MDSRSYIKLTGNLLEGGIIPPVTGSTGTTGSTIITGETTPVAIKKFNLGGWNMNSSSNLTKNISTGVPLSKIITVDAIIKSDGGELFKIEKSSSNWETAGYIKVCNTPTANAVVSVTHNDAGSSFFRQSGFDSTSINRGWVIVTYSNIQPPTINTGNVPSLTSTSIVVNGNVILNNGGSEICEYGVVWSQSNSNPTITTGTKVCTLGTIAAGVPYNKTLSGLQDTTNTWFRAYAKNCEETGYGIIKQQMTCSAATPTNTYLGVQAINEYGQYADGYITLNEVYDTYATCKNNLGAAQCVQILINYNQSAQNSGDLAELRLYCCPFGGYYSEIYLTPPATTDNARYYGSGGGTFWLCKGEAICWQNQVSSGGGYAELCSRLYVTVASAVNITASSDSCYDNLVSN